MSYLIILFVYLSLLLVLYTHLGGTFSSYLQKLVKIQKRAIRCICNLRKFDSTTASFNDLEILKITDIHKYMILIFMFKYHSNLLPKCFDNYFSTIATLHNYTTRQKDNLHAPFYKYNLSKRSFYYYAVNLWNSLGSKIISNASSASPAPTSMSVSSFKKSLKTHLLNTYV